MYHRQGNIGHKIHKSFCFSFPLVTEIFTKGVWMVYNSFENPELQRLASSLPRTVLASRTDSTTKKYLYRFMKWKVWAESKSASVPSSKPALCLVPPTPRRDNRF